MLSQMQNNCRRNYENDTDKSINREDQDKIDILDGNCSFDINVIPSQNRYILYLIIFVRFLVFRIR